MVRMVLVDVIIKLISLTSLHKITRLPQSWICSRSVFQTIKNLDGLLKFWSGKGNVVVGSCQRLSFTTPTVEDAVFARRKQRILVSLSSITTYSDCCNRSFRTSRKEVSIKSSKVTLSQLVRF